MQPCQALSGRVQEGEIRFHPLVLPEEGNWGPHALLSLLVLNVSDQSTHCLHLQIEGKNATKHMQESRAVQLVE
jgi:hypothetical protein